MSAVEWTPIEREYSPSSMVASLDALIDGYRVQSEKTRASVSYTTHAYGTDPTETLDLFHAGPGSPVHVFVHGGYWQDLSKDDSSFPASGFLARGTSFVAVNYGLAPAFTLAAIVEQLERAVHWIADHAAELGLDPRRIVVSGSSAGAHLAATVGLRERMIDSSSTPAIAGLVLLSGVYDLTPLIDTYINDAIGLDEISAPLFSPLNLIREAISLPPVLICYGEHETISFKMQSARLAETWRYLGGSAVSAEIAGRNHFDIVHDLAEPETQLGDLVLLTTQEWQCP